MKRSLTAHTLMLLLATGTLAIFAASVIGFFFTQNYLARHASEVSRVASEAEASRTRVQQLQQTEKELERYTGAIDRTAKIVAESKSYEYQDQIINDITNYANRAGVGITSFAFNDASAPSATGSAPTATQAPAASTTPAASGLKTTSVIVNLKPDVPYNNVLNLLSLVENNLTKMQIADIALTKSEEGDPNAVSLQSLNLEVYIK